MILQVAGPLLLAMAQEIPGPLGSGSVRVVPVESPGPPLVSVIVKPMVPPALTELASGVFVMERLGQYTASEADAEPLDTLLEVKLAVFL